MRRHPVMEIYDTFGESGLSGIPYIAACSSDTCRRAIGFVPSTSVIWYSNPPGRRTNAYSSRRGTLTIRRLQGGSESNKEGEKQGKKKTVHSSIVLGEGDGDIPVVCSFKVRIREAKEELRHLACRGCEGGTSSRTPLRLQSFHYRAATLT